MIQPAAVLTAVIQHREAAARPAAHFTVRRGETLSGIAARYHIQWPGLYEKNRKTIGADPSALRPGEHLRIPAETEATHLAKLYREAVAAPAPAAQQAETTVYSASYSEPAAASYSGASGSFQSCVIAAESGGSSQVMNGSGHYGLYQFSYGTWVANGGSGSEFGNASVAEQNQVFHNTVASSGTSAWAPYDGC